MGYLLLFSRVFLRPLRKEPVRTSLTVFAVALGVAVVLAIDLAGKAAAGSFHASLETLVGGADFEVTAIGGVPEKVAATLARLPYPLEIRPRIEGFATLPDARMTAPLIGVDMLADAPPASDDAQSFKPLLDRDSVWVSSGLGFKPGDKIELIINDQPGTYTVRGLLRQRPGAIDDGNVVVMDIALAIEVLGRRGRLDRILIRVPRTRTLRAWETILRQALPAEVSLEREGTRTDENRRMLEAFRWNLQVLSYIALVVGAFLIYNTIVVSVVRRRAEIGILRALGASRTAILASFLGESAFFGFVGAVLGVFLGRLMAVGAVRLIASTVEQLYVTSRPAAVSLRPVSVIEALVIGLGAAFFSALPPAREAARMSAAQAMARDRAEYEAHIEKMRDLAVGAALGLGAVVASRISPVDGKPLFGYLSVLLLIAACAFAIPAMTAGVVAVTAGALRRLFGVEAFLACRSLVASLRRTSVLVGSLSTAVAMMVSVGIMVGSFRQTVLIWMQNQLQADLYLRPAAPSSADRHPTMAPEIAEKLSSVPGVAAVGWLRAYSISYEGLPATLAAVNSQVAARFSRRIFASGGDRRKIFDELSEGDSVIVSEPFANKHHVRPGDTITLPLGDRERTFRVLGVYYDYSDERGFVIMDRSTLLKYLPDPAPSSLAIYLKPGAGLDEVRQAVERACAGHAILVSSSSALRREALRIFDRTFAITYALEAIAIAVAVMGIAGALLALVIDRRRELGLLRFMGAFPGQVHRLILFEAGFLGLLSNLAGLALGILLSLILLFVVNKQSFGWTIQFHPPVAILFAGLSLVYLATVAAGLYPARLAVGMKPIEVIHEE